VRDGGKPEVHWSPAPGNEALIARVTQLAEGKLREAFATKEKQARTDKLRAVSSELFATLEAEAAAAGTPAPDSAELGDILFSLESKIVRSQILDGEPRIDGRDTRTVRPISIRSSVLPRTHGSALLRVVKPRRWSWLRWVRLETSKRLMR